MVVQDDPEIAFLHGCYRMEAHNRVPIKPVDLCRDPIASEEVAKHDPPPESWCPDDHRKHRLVWKALPRCGNHRGDVADFWRGIEGGAYLVLDDCWLKRDQRIEQGSEDIR